MAVQEVHVRNPLDVMRLRTPATDQSLHRPFSGAYGTGLRTNVKNPLGNHQGWDLLASVGTPAYSIATGKVHGVYPHLPGYGRAVVIEFEFRGRTLYAIYGHLSSILVKNNQPVSEGDVVARTGISGNAGGTKPHLHFGIMISPLPQHGMAAFISPGHILGYTSVSGLTTDDYSRLDMA
jgi:murein DD-endopeptidase MepM/ murein hydrolase activator NlpD